MAAEALSDLGALDRFALARAAAASVPNQLLVAGLWSESASGARFAVEDPATGEPIAMVADAGPRDARVALDAAVRAAPEWAATAPDRRAAILRAVGAELRRRTTELAALLTLEMGKPLAESTGEVAYAADFFTWYAEEARRIAGTTTTAPAGHADILTLRSPVGPCLLVTPWNFPLAMPARKLAPALAAGCTTVLKPSELTPLSALALADILHHCGIPAGVVNVLLTTDAAALVEPLLADERLRKLSFTGSTAVGKRLMAQAAQGVLRLSLELGGNAPFLVCADADLDAAVDGAFVAKMRNGGQACTAANRFYVERPLAAEFVRRLSDRLGALRLGHGLDDDVEVGPLINRAAAGKVTGLVESAVAGGAHQVASAKIPAGARETFVAPTVLTDVPPDAELLRSEIFGPVAPVVVIDGIEDALRRANDTRFGLAAYAYTGSLHTAHRLATGLEAGMVAINGGLVSNVAAPFGGVKWSGLGREGAAVGLHEFLEERAITLHNEIRYDLRHDHG